MTKATRIGETVAYHGDCIETMDTLIALGVQVDSIVTDPPYGLQFMGKEWDKLWRNKTAADQQYVEDNAGTLTSRARKLPDYAATDQRQMQLWHEEWAKRALQLLKPGGYLLAFSGSRTYHRMACAIEDAGFEIRDMLSWNYGVGFPKSHDVVKKLKADGRICTCHKTMVSHHHVSEEIMRDLRNGVVPEGPVSSGPESDVLTGMQESIDRAQGDGTRQASDSVDTMRDVRQTGTQGTVTRQKEHGDLLQPFVSIQNVRESSEKAFRQYEGTEAGTAVRGEKSGLEGRCDAETSEGQLQGREVRSSAGVGETDGAEGRIHNGASSSDGSNVRVPFDSNRSGEPRGSQSEQQSPVEPDTLSDQRRPQTRGGWPICPGCGKPVVPEGLGSALKPAHEPVVMARKPLIGTVAANVLEHGTGALNIDACRVETSDKLGGGMVSKGRPKASEGWDRPWMHDPAVTERKKVEAALKVAEAEASGRFPANVLHDGSDEVLEAFAAYGDRK